MVLLVEVTAGENLLKLRPTTSTVRVQFPGTGSIGRRDDRIGNYLN